MVPEEVEKVCRLFAIDPFTSISEGTLVLTCKKHRTAEILARLAAKGIAAAVIGETLPEAEGITLVEGGRARALEHPRVDPFWAAFGKAMAEGDRARAVRPGRWGGLSPPLAVVVLSPRLCGGRQAASARAANLPCQDEEDPLPIGSGSQVTVKDHSEIEEGPAGCRSGTRVAVRRGSVCRKIARAWFSRLRSVAALECGRRPLDHDRTSRSSSSRRPVMSIALGPDVQALASAKSAAAARRPELCDMDQCRRHCPLPDAGDHRSPSQQRCQLIDRRIHPIGSRPSVRERGALASPAQRLHEVAPASDPADLRFGSDGSLAGRLGARVFVTDVRSRRSRQLS